MKKLIAILAFLGLLLFAGIGSATTITFEDIVIPNPGDSSKKMDSSYAGLDWTWYGGKDEKGGWYVIDDVRVMTWGAPDSPSGTIAAFNGYTSNYLWIESSSLFNFTSAEFAGMGVYGPEYITVEAYVDTTLIDSVTMMLSGGSYSTLFGSSLMEGINRLRLSYTPYNSEQTGYWLMDNFTYANYVEPNGEIPVPEPATLILFGLGLIGLGLARQK